MHTRELITTPIKANPFYNDCSLEALKTGCVPVGGGRFIAMLPRYSLLFSINQNSGLKMREFTGNKYSYETYCEESERLDFFNDTCTLVNSNVTGDIKHLYLLNRSTISEKYAVMSIIAKMPEKQLQESLKIQNESLCYQVIRNNLIFAELWKDTPQLHSKFCIMVTETFEEFTEAYEYANNLHSAEKTSTEVLIFNAFLQNSTGNCNLEDVLSTKAYIFNVSGDFVLATNVGGQKYMTRLKESTIVVRLTPSGGSLRLKGSVIAIFCRKIETTDDDYLGIITAVCNSISLAFLFATTSLYVMVKPLRLKVVCAIPHLAMSLFFAQIVFQVSSVLDNLSISVL